MSYHIIPFGTAINYFIIIVVYYYQKGKGGNIMRRENVLFVIGIKKEKNIRTGNGKMLIIRGVPVLNV